VQPGYGRAAFRWSALTIASIGLTAAYVLWELNTKGHAHLTLAIPMFDLILLSVSIILIVLWWRSRSR
jgi:CHASE2 domain-containing sensor protein